MPSEKKKLVDFHTCYFQNFDFLWAPTITQSFHSNNKNNNQKLNTTKILAKKSYRYIIAALLTIMGIAAPLAMKAVGLIAYKALVISSVALTIAGIIALKKIYSSDRHDETTFHVASGDHNRRTAYFARPAAPHSSPVDSQTDPYRYYYDYPTQTTQ